MAAVEPAFAADELEDELLDEALLDDEVLLVLVLLLPQAANSAAMAGAASPKAAPRFSTSRRLIRCSRAARVSCSMRDNLDTGVSSSALCGHQARPRLQEPSAVSPRLDACTRPIGWYKSLGSL